MIAAGRLKISGRVAVLGQKLALNEPANNVRLDDQPLRQTAYSKKLYLLLDKPVGYLCSRRSQGDTPTIYRLLPQNYAHLKPVGRLDKNSSGLLLLTNDGEYAHRLTHPSFGKIKRYEVSLNLPLAPDDQQRLSREGVPLPDGISRFSLDRLFPDNDRIWLVTMSEGRNRQIRRSFAALGLLVTRLHRVSLGPYHLSQLAGSLYKEVPKEPL